MSENQSLEDAYHQAKVHLDGILPNQDDSLTIDRTFIGDTDRAFRTFWYFDKIKFDVVYGV